MDILRDLKSLIFENGFQKWIDDFKNPNQEFFGIYSVKYDKKISSRVYIYDESHPKYNPFTNGKHVIHIDTAFQTYLEREESSFGKTIDNLRLLVVDNLPLKDKVFLNIPDFSLFRNKIQKVSPSNTITDLLIIHVGKIERILTDFYNKERLANRKSISAKKKVGFEFNGNSKLIDFLYYGLILEKGGFIDRDHTSFEVFQSIMTSLDVKNEKGYIHFGCETKQATYIITKIQRYFKNLTFAAIEQSDKFRSKRNRPIKADSLSRYKSSRPEVKEKEQIDKLLQSFL